MAYTITQKIKNPDPGREYAHKTIHDDGTTTITYGPTPDPKDATDLGSKSSAAKPESKPKSEPKAKPTVNSAVKNAAKPATKPLSKLDLVPDMGEGVVSRIKSRFTDSPFNPKNAALAFKGRTLQANPVAYAANAYGMGSGGGYMPVGEHTADKLRIEHGKDELSNQGTNVPINPQGTQYLDPTLGVVDTQVLEDEDGMRYYKNAQTGQFDPLDSGAPFRYSSIPVEQTPFPKFRAFNIGDDIGYTIDSDANKPLPPMSVDATETKPTQPTVASVVKPKRVTKPTVVNNTPAANITPVSTSTSNVSAPTLSSVTSQAVRHNGGFDNYRRESVLSALRAAGGISPAEAIQRGIIPWEALNYV